jgi:hypothetical protein
MSSEIEEAALQERVQDAISYAIKYKRDLARQLREQAQSWRSEARRIEMLAGAKRWMALEGVIDPRTSRRSGARARSCGGVVSVSQSKRATFSHARMPMIQQIGLHDTRFCVFPSLSVGRPINVNHH